MTAEEHFDAVVIGSGFGGSVVAYRLAEAGRSVLVLERGQPYPPGAFPRTPYELRTSFWDPSNALYGLLDLWWFDRLDAAVASGLGGGSLIYANVMLRKDEKTFVHEEQADGSYESWPVTRAELDPHYDAVEEIQKPQPFPLAAGKPYDTTPKTRALLQAAAKMRLSADTPPLAVLFAPGQGQPPVPGIAVRDGGENLHGAPRSTCRLCGECDLGCNFGAKNTLDFTYLSRAMQAGAQLRTCCEAQTIIPREHRGGGFRVGYRQHFGARAGHPEALLDPTREPYRAVSAADVVLAAGAVATPYLLLSNRAALPRLSRALGTRVSGNGDYVGWIRDCRQPSGRGWRYLEPSRGPVITTSIEVDANRSPSGRSFVIQDAGAPNFADWLWQTTELPADVIRAARTMLRRRWGSLRGRRDTAGGAVAASLLGDAHASAAMLPVLAMGRDVPNGRYWLRGKRLELDWRPASSEPYYAGVREQLRMLARALDGRFKPTPLDRRRRSVSVHMVGGCPMGGDSRRGVVDRWGQVYGHPGLWIADGSVMPGPVGVNPSFTIAALADRFANAMLERPSVR